MASSKDTWVTGSTGRKPNGGRPWKKGQSGNPGGRPKGSKTLLYDVRNMFARAIMEGDVLGKDVEEAAIRRIQENLTGKKTVLGTLELAARLNKEIGIGSEDRPPGVQIHIHTNLQPGSLRRRSA